jgi:hypothetical protein
MTPRVDPLSDTIGVTDGLPAEGSGDDVPEMVGETLGARIWGPELGGSKVPGVTLTSTPMVSSPFLLSE